MKLLKILFAAAVLTVTIQAHAVNRVEAAAYCAGNYHIIADEALKRNRGDIYNSAKDAESYIYSKFVNAPGFQANYAAALANKSLDWPTRGKLAVDCGNFGF